MISLTNERKNARLRANERAAETVEAKLVRQRKKEWKRPGERES